LCILTTTVAFLVDAAWMMAKFNRTNEEDEWPGVVAMVEPFAIPGEVLQYDLPLAQPGLYRLFFFDLDSGMCCDWFTITTNAVTDENSQGSVMWHAPGKITELWLEVYIWVGEAGIPEVVEYEEGIVVFSNGTATTNIPEGSVQFELISSEGDGQVPFDPSANDTDWPGRYPPVGPLSTSGLRLNIRHDDYPLGTCEKRKDSMPIFFSVIKYSFSFTDSIAENSWSWKKMSDETQLWETLDGPGMVAELSLSGLPQRSLQTYTLAAVESGLFRLDLYDSRRDGFCCSSRGRGWFTVTAVTNRADRVVLWERVGNFTYRYELTIRIDLNDDTVNVVTAASWDADNATTIEYQAPSLAATANPFDAYARPLMKSSLETLDSPP